MFSVSVPYCEDKAFNIKHHARLKYVFHILIVFQSPVSFNFKHYFPIAGQRIRIE
jgi:hypothetical protein